MHPRANPVVVLIGCALAWSASVSARPKPPPAAPTDALPLRLELAPASAFALLRPAAPDRPQGQRSVRRSVPPPPPSPGPVPERCALAPLAPVAPWVAMFGAVAAASWAGAKEVRFEGREGKPLSGYPPTAR